MRDWSSAKRVGGGIRGGDSRAHAGVWGFRVVSPSIERERLYASFLIAMSPHPSGISAIIYIT